MTIVDMPAFLVGWRWRGDRDHAPCEVRVPYWLLHRGIVTIGDMRQLGLELGRRHGRRVTVTQDERDVRWFRFDFAKPPESHHV